MNSRCCAFAVLLLLSGSALAADTPLPAMSPVGLWLITLGIVFLIAEAALPNYGVIGLGGIIMFVIGALILSNAELPVPMMIGLGLISALLLMRIADPRPENPTAPRRQRRCRPGRQRDGGDHRASGQCPQRLGATARRTLASAQRDTPAHRAIGARGRRARDYCCKWPRLTRRRHGE